MTPSPQSQVRVLLADDSAIMLRAVSKLLATHQELELVAAVADFSEATRLAEELQPDVIVVDLHLAAASAKAEALRLKEERRLRLLAITAAAVDNRTLAMAAAIGAEKLLDKMELDEELIPTIFELANASR
jgi:chemotaxis response regulator CheB